MARSKLTPVIEDVGRSATTPLTSADSMVVWAVIVGGLASRTVFDMNTAAWVTLPKSFKIRILTGDGPEHVAEPHQLHRPRGEDESQRKKQTVPA